MLILVPMNKERFEKKGLTVYLSSALCTVLGVVGVLTTAFWAINWRLFEWLCFFCLVYLGFHGRVDHDGAIAIHDKIDLARNGCLQEVILVQAFHGKIDAPEPHERICQIDGHRCRNDQPCLWLSF